jgi:hypothetical protein
MNRRECFAGVVGIASLGLLRQDGSFDPELQNDASRYKSDYESACKLVAEMHAAAVGEWGTGPKRGVVEDIEDLRKEVLELRAENERMKENEEGGIKINHDLILNDLGNSIKYIENPSEEFQLEAVNQSVWAIQYIKNPSEQVQLEAVKQNSYTVQYIKNPSEQVQLEAVKQNSDLILHIENPTEKVQLEAIKQSGWAIRHIKNPSEQVQLEVVKRNIDLIQFIEKPTEKVQLEAIKKDPFLFHFIQNPCEQAVKLHRLNCSRYNNVNLI